MSLIAAWTLAALLALAVVADRTLTRAAAVALGVPLRLSASAAVADNSAEQSTQGAAPHGAIR